MATVNHFFALSNPALVSALPKKSISSPAAQSLRAALSGPARSRWSWLRRRNISSSLQQLPLPFRYLRCMDLVLLSELNERLIATQCRYCHFGFEAARVVTSCSLRHALAPVIGPATEIVKQGLHLSNCPNFRSHLYLL